MIQEISKGYGFINCENKKTYQRIIETKNHEVKGRIVEVNLALNKHSEVPEEIKSKGLRKLFVGGLPQGSTKDELIAYFSAFGNILNCYLIFDPQTKASKSRSFTNLDFGYVEFQTLDGAETALKMPSHFINGKRITVENHRNGYNTYVGQPNKQKESKGQNKCPPAPRVKEHQASDDLKSKGQRSPLTHPTTPLVNKQPPISGRFPHSGILAHNSPVIPLAKRDDRCILRKFADFYSDIKRISLQDNNFSSPDNYDGDSANYLFRMETDIVYYRRCARLYNF